MGEPASQSYVSRGGEKLAAALDHFGIDVTELVCADLGSHIGGFVDCLLQRGVAKVYSVDTSYGTLAWKLRRDPRVVVMERTNAMHVTLPEPVDLVTIDVGWTPQAKILPNVAKLLKPGGHVVTLIKPQYEAPFPSPLQKGGKRGVSERKFRHADQPHTEPQEQARGVADHGRKIDTVLSDEAAQEVIARVLREIEDSGWSIRGRCTSPIRGQGGNMEVLVRLAMMGPGR